MNKKKSGRKDYDISPEAFIEIWQTSRSAQEAADRLGMPKGIVHARASNYRDAGIKLKRMPRKSIKSLDVVKLNQLAGSFHDGGGSCVEDTVKKVVKTIQRQAR